MCPQQYVRTILCLPKIIHVCPLSIQCKYPYTKHRHDTTGDLYQSSDSVRKDKQRDTLETADDSVWREMPPLGGDGPLSVADGVLLAISESRCVLHSKQTAFYALHRVDKKWSVENEWKLIGELPLVLSRDLDTLLLSDGKLLVVDNESGKVLKVTVKGKHLLQQNISNSIFFQVCEMSCFLVCHAH